MKPFLTTLMICIAAPSMAVAQTNDVEDGTERSPTYDEQKTRSVESERERLGNQRIQTEAEIREREEQRRLEEAEQERLRAEEEAISNKVASAPGSELRPSEAGGSVDMSRTLEQLRTLGELKNDGYITEEEFAKIKQKILGDQNL
jgi:hypothetical protein